MKKIVMIWVVALSMATTAWADDRNGRIQIGTGLLYENGKDLTIGYEYETKYHNAWEFFGNAYLKWAECASCGHVCPESFWNNYRTWGLGVAYKPCIVRERNHYGSLRLGGSLGSGSHNMLGGIHVGYEHSYSLKKGWQLYWQVKSDIMIEGKDLFRTGITIGIKIPTR